MLLYIPNIYMVWFQKLFSKLQLSVSPNVSNECCTNTDSSLHDLYILNDFDSTLHTDKKNL